MLKEIMPQGEEMKTRKMGSKICCVILHEALNKCNVATIECFHMMSRRPYWCPKTMKRPPCWCPKPSLRELNSFLMQTLSFVPINLHICWPREWKHSIHIHLYLLKRSNYRIQGHFFTVEPASIYVICSIKPKPYETGQAKVVHCFVG